MNEHLKQKAESSHTTPDQRQREIHRRLFAHTDHLFSQRLKAQGITVVESPDSRFATDDLDDEICLRLFPDQDGDSFLYLDIDASNQTTLSLEYLDHGQGQFCVEFNSHDGPSTAAVPGLLCFTEAMSLGESQQWRRVNFELDQFMSEPGVASANACIHVWGGQGLLIRDLRVEKSPATTGATRLDTPTPSRGRWYVDDRGQIRAEALMRARAEDSWSTVIRRPDGYCLVARNPFGPPQVYFRLHHRLSGKQMRIVVEVLAGSPDRLWLDYDSSDAQVRMVPAAPGAFKQTQKFCLCASDSWSRYTFDLEDMQLSRRCHGADFRVTTDCPEHQYLALRQIEVTTLE